MVLSIINEETIIGRSRTGPMTDAQGKLLGQETYPIISKENVKAGGIKGGSVDRSYRVHHAVAIRAAVDA